MAGMTFVAKALGDYSVEVSRVQFIPPALPKLRASLPTGEGRLYELKFDSCRRQLHKACVSFAIYGLNGGDITRRFPAIAAAILGLPTKPCIGQSKMPSLWCGKRGQCVPAPRSSECPAFRRDHWTMGRPSVR